MPKGIIKKQSIKNTFILYAGIGLGFVATILLFPRILSPAEYGLTRLLFSLGLVCSQFAHLGINKLIIRYFPYFRDSRQSKSRFLTASLLTSLCGFILFVILFLILQKQFLASFQDRSALFADYELLLIPIVFGILFYKILNSYFRALHDAVTGTLVHEVILRSLIIVILIVFYFRLISFTAFMFFFIACYILQPLILLSVLYQRGELSFAFPRLHKSAYFLKEMGVYTWYSFLGGLSSIIIGNIDIIMIGAILTLDDTAVYAIAFYISSVITVPQRSILQIASPVLAGLIKEKRFDEVHTLYRKTSLDQIIAGSLIYIGIWANMHNIMHLLPPQYHGTKWIILSLGAAKLFNMATGVNGAIILNSKYFRFSLYVNILLVILAIITNYLLIPILGLMGAAIATVLSIVIYDFVKLIFVWIKLSMQPFRWQAPVVIIIAAICLILSFQIPYLYNFFIDVTVRSFSIAIVFIGAILLFHLSDDVEDLALEAVRRAKIIFKNTLMN
jgi:O-antigen/teichoic acid export membrane protein